MTTKSDNNNIQDILTLGSSASSLKNTQNDTAGDMVHASLHNSLQQLLGNFQVVSKFLTEPQKGRQLLGIHGPLGSAQNRTKNSVDKPISSKNCQSLTDTGQDIIDDRVYKEKTHKHRDKRKEHKSNDSSKTTDNEMKEKDNKLRAMVQKMQKLADPPLSCMPADRPSFVFTNKDLPKKEKDTKSADCKTEIETKKTETYDGLETGTPITSKGIQPNVINDGPLSDNSSNEKSIQLSKTKADNKIPHNNNSTMLSQSEPRVNDRWSKGLDLFSHLFDEENTKKVSEREPGKEIGKEEKKEKPKKCGKGEKIKELEIKKQIYKDIKYLKKEKQKIEASKKKVKPETKVVKDVQTPLTIVAEDTPIPSAQDILRLQRQVSPLLSPIPQLPPLSVDTSTGRPSLICRMHLNLIDRIPQPMKLLSPIHNQSPAQTSDEPQKRKEMKQEMPLDKRKREKDKKKKREDNKPAKKVDDKPENSPRATAITGADCDKVASIPNDMPILTAQILNASPSRKRNVTDVSKNCDDLSVTKKRQKMSSPFAASQPPSLVLSNAPTAPFELEKELLSADHYLLVKAKPLKRMADAQPDKTQKMLTYLESVVYFVMSIRALKQANPGSSRPDAMIRDTFEMLKEVTGRYTQYAMDKSIDSDKKDLAGRIRVLSLKTQALFCYHLYHMQSGHAMANYRTISEFTSRGKHLSGSNAPSGSSGYVSSGSQPHQTSPSSPTPSPSPASSVGSGSAASLQPGQVQVPQVLESAYRTQLSVLHRLMFAHCYWEESEKLLNSEQINKDFFGHIDSLCGTLSIHTTLGELCVNLLTCVNWLRQLSLR